MDYEKLCRLALIEPDMADHFVNLEPVELQLSGDNQMAVYRLRDGLGALIWWRGGRGPRSNPLNFLMLRKDGSILKELATVGNLYGWKYTREAPPHNMCGRNTKEADDRWGAWYRDEKAKRNSAVSTATSEACKRLGVTRLVTYGGDFRQTKIRGLTLLGGYRCEDPEFTTETFGWHKHCLVAPSPA